MSQVHLIIGPVGAGKSTFARTLCKRENAINLNLDAWMATLYGQDTRPAKGVLEWYVERRDRCLEQLWTVAQQAINVGTGVVLEIGLIQQKERSAFYQRVEKSGYPLQIYLLEAPKELRRQRVVHRNQSMGETFSMNVPPHIFELASDMWQAPSQAEKAQHNIIVVEQSEMPMEAENDSL